MTKICFICGKEFTILSYRKNIAKYCSYKCRNISYKTSLIGKNNPFYEKKHSKKTKRQLSKFWKGKRMGSNHWNWRGGIYISTWGYIYIYQPNHPFADNRRCVRRSHLTMEKIIGRYIQRGEIVHHINKIRDDDRPENLQLFSNQSEHRKFHSSH